MRVELHLYITGHSGTSKHALRCIEELCREYLSHWTIEVIDVLEQPERAEADKIIATPTLVRRLPAPARKIVGDLRQRDRLLAALGLSDAPIQESR